MGISKRIISFWVFLLICSVVIGGQFNKASAHVSLEGQRPQAEEVLSTAPNELELAFSEPVNVRYVEVKLYNDQGQQVEVLRSQETGYSNTVTFKTQQHHEGTYAVVWQAVSPDGHEVSGQYHFSIGHQTVTKIETTKPFYTNSFWWLGVMRFFMQGSVLILTGLYMVNRLMARQDIPTYDVIPKCRRVIWLLIILVGLTGILYLMTLPKTVMKDLLHLDITTWLAFPFMLSTVALITTLILFSLKNMERIWYHAMPLCIFISLAISGHVWAQDVPLYALTIRTLHLAAIALWLGSFVYLICYLRARERHSYVLILRDVLLKSNLSAVFVIVLTGILMTIDATSIQALVTQQTIYSGLWFGKLLFTIVLVVLGGVQSIWAMQKKRHISQSLLYIELLIGLFLILAGVTMSQIVIPL
ncbi:copper resistance CopC/CopD family protein [Staphylococcus americanisciuri]|uniref:Copper resistance protein CopC n=1 Tax=Staphylococcus americanisciuri TaxID=2973940 RepID=A0ABT2F110_9STAP|nr:copper resistance CopC family protein [Staphylococcus americanisciuri]MCS4486110.1 copper resistance protein CopC [Staphylococcus americanisciuri]